MEKANNTNPEMLSVLLDKNRRKSLWSVQRLTNCWEFRCPKKLVQVIIASQSNTVQTFPKMGSSQAQILHMMSDS